MCEGNILYSFVTRRGEDMLWPSARWKLPAETEIREVENSRDSNRKHNDTLSTTLIQFNKIQVYFDANCAFKCVLHVSACT